MSAVRWVKLLSTCHLPSWRALCTNVVVGHSCSYRCRPAMLTPSSATVAMRNLTVARFIVDSSINADAHGSALIFASDRQLQQLQSATSVFFDATFKVVPHIYYHNQLFTIIIPHADYAFPALYALMSRKTQSLNAAVFEKVNQL